MNETDLVLRACEEGPIDNLTYEHEVLGRLKKAGWPVPQLVSDLLRVEGRVWRLFTALPGKSATTIDAREMRARGRLLAELHETTRSLVSMGQRQGFQKADELVRNPSLLEALRYYERLQPEAGFDWQVKHLLRRAERHDARIPRYGPIDQP